VETKDWAHKKKEIVLNTYSAVLQKASFSINSSFASKK
jgi:hypothetical protein